MLFERTEDGPLNYIPTWAQKMEYYGWYTVFFEIAVREIEIAVTLKGHRIKKIPKVSNVFKKHKHFGFMTLLQCEKKTVVQYFATSSFNHRLVGSVGRAPVC